MDNSFPNSIQEEFKPNSGHNDPKRKLEEPKLAIKENQNPLDLSVTEQELKENISGLKPNKASGPDGLLNQTVKHSPKFQWAVLTLCNPVLSVM